MCWQTIREAGLYEAQQRHTTRVSKRLINKRKLLKSLRELCPYRFEDDHWFPVRKCYIDDEFDNWMIYHCESNINLVLLPSADNKDKSDDLFDPLTPDEYIKRINNVINQSLFYHKKRKEKINQIKELIFSDYIDNYPRLVKLYNEMKACYEQQTHSNNV